jgi:hypothetical protein
MGPEDLVLGPRLGIVDTQVGGAHGRQHVADGPLELLLLGLGQAAAHQGLQQPVDLHAAVDEVHPGQRELAEVADEAVDHDLLAAQHRVDLLVGGHEGAAVDQ